MGLYIYLSKYNESWELLYEYSIVHFTYGWILTV